MGHHLHAEVIGLAEVDGHAVEHAIILVGVVSDHVGAMAVIGREVEAGLVPEVDVTEFVAVHISRRQGGVTQTNVTIVVVGTERAHLPEARTADTTCVAYLELVEFVYRIVDVGTREEVEIWLATIDGVVAVVGIAFQVGQDVGHLGTQTHLSRPAAPFVAQTSVEGSHLLAIFVVVAIVGQRLPNAVILLPYAVVAQDVAVGVFSTNFPLRLGEEGMHIVDAGLQVAHALVVARLLIDGP